MEQQLSHINSIPLVLDVIDYSYKLNFPLEKSTLGSYLVHLESLFKEKYTVERDRGESLQKAFFILTQYKLDSQSLREALLSLFFEQVALNNIATKRVVAIVESIVFNFPFFKTSFVP